MQALDFHMLQIICIGYFGTNTTNGLCKYKTIKLTGGKYLKTAFHRLGVAGITYKKAVDRPGQDTTDSDPAHFFP